MDLSSDQKIALNKLVTWFNDPNKKQFITLGGYAGTGKTTLISILKKELVSKDKSLEIVFCSYTGKAAQNLKNKLKLHDKVSYKDTISTIHGLIYDPIENSNEEIVGWERKSELEKDLIIIDEASMVDANIWQDLLSYHIPIVAVGDHGQLPPISGKFNLMEKPEIILTEIHRQAKENPIIAVSKFAREFGTIPAKEFGKKVIKYSRGDADSTGMSTELLETYSKDMLILCGYNSTRTKLNHYLRKNLGFESDNPEPGDRVICLRNNHKRGVYNGMLGTIKHLKLTEKDWYEAEIKMDDNEKHYIGLIYAQQFGATTAVNFTENRKNAMKGDLFDFGYALTVHKAQGSQAKKVVLFEERFKQMDDDMWKKWLYTAVTRAEEELYIFG